MSQLVQGFLDSDQAGLEDSDGGLRVTSADSCPNFPGFVLLAQQLPERGLRVTARPKPQTPHGAVARGTPAAADAPRTRKSCRPFSRRTRAVRLRRARPHAREQLFWFPSADRWGRYHFRQDRHRLPCRHPHSVDDDALASPAATPPPDPTPGVGLFWRADLGHFSRAPKGDTQNRP